MGDAADLQSWTVIAQNLPEHATNPIHTDVGAQAAGFPRALVAGVTTYAYLTHPAAAGWGLDWLERGGGEVRFRRPVFDGDQLECRPVVDEGAAMIAGITGITGADGAADGDQPRAVFELTRQAAGPTLRDGEPLPLHRIRLEGEWGSGYGSRAGDPLDLYERHGIVHPAVWPALANRVVHAEVARGPWIHTRSIIRHHALGRVGREAIIRAHVVRRFEAHGERAVLDVVIEVDGEVVASLEHEAIVALP